MGKRMDDQDIGLPVSTIKKKKIDFAISSKLNQIYEGLYTHVGKDESWK